MDSTTTIHSVVLIQHPLALAVGHDGKWAMASVETPGKLGVMHNTWVLCPHVTLLLS